MKTPQYSWREIPYSLKMLPNQWTLLLINAIGTTSTHSKVNLKVLKIVNFIKIKYIKDLILLFSWSITKYL